MSETVRFQEVLRRLAMVDETFVTGQAGLGLGPAGSGAPPGPWPPAPPTTRSPMCCW
jgi:hypothetical protein